MLALTDVANQCTQELSADFADKLRWRLAEVRPDCGVAEHERRISATLDFLAACAIPGAPSLAPSPAIDQVWHEMIMHTADYRELCLGLGVAFIDHEPAGPHSSAMPSVEDTVTFMRSRGIATDNAEDLWQSDGATKCCGHRVVLVDDARV